jgi:transcription elongation GreA/GreB family factor
MNPHLTGASMSLSIGLGSHVLFTVAGRNQSFTLVEPEEANPSGGLLSVQAPVGRALIGHHAGETVDVRTPRGLQQLAVVAVD